MQFSALLIAAVAFSSAAALEFTNTVFNNVTAGKPFTFTWADAKGPVTITLKNGDPLALKTVTVITSGQTGKSYTWDVPATLASDTYAFEITDGVSKPNYSVQTQLIGGVVSSSSSASGSASVTSTGTSSSASASATGFTNSTTSSESSSSTGTGTSTRSSTRTSASSTSSGSATSSPTSAPGGSMAAGFTSNLAFVFVAVAALMTLN